MRRSRRLDLSPRGWSLQEDFFSLPELCTRLRPRLRVSKKDLKMTVGGPNPYGLHRKAGGLTLLHVIWHRSVSM